MAVTQQLKGTFFRILREPLLQFLVLGGTLFFTAHGVAKHHEFASREIVIDNTLTHRLARMYELQTGTAPSKDRLDSLVNDYVRDEVLFREAMQMGLDQNDEIIRRRLTQKIDFIQRDMLVVAEPAQTELQNFYQSHLDQFSEPGVVSFTHAFFSPDKGGSTAAKARAEKALKQLQHQTTESPSQLARQVGDHFPLQYDYVNLTKIDAAQLFGKSPIVDALFAASTGGWVGPFNSGYGWHLLYVSNKKEAAAPAFERVKDRVREAYLEQAREKNNALKFAELKSKYVISRAETQAAQ